MKIFQVVGYKHSGKTTLICRLVETLVRQGYRVGTVKHDAHRFEIDHPGTDTWRHRQAGAHKVAITSPQRTAFVEERPASLDELIAGMQGMDFVLVEGFKRETYPKIVVVRSAEEADILDLVENAVAVASWTEWSRPKLPVFHIDDVAGIVNFMK